MGISGPEKYNWEKMTDPLRALQVSTEITGLLADRPTVPQFLSLVARALRRHYACTAVHLWLSRPDAGGGEDIVGVDPDNAGRGPFPESIWSVAHTACQEQRTVLKAAVGPTQGAAESKESAWILAFPLLTAEDALGAAVLRFTGEHGPPVVACDIFRAIGAHIGTLVRHLERYHLLRQEREGLVEAHARLQHRVQHLEARYAQLKRLDEAKTGFITVASHELRTPLTVLSGYSQMLASDPLVADDPYRAQLIQGIQQGATRLRTIVDDMLDMARIDSRTLQIQPEPLFPAVLIKSIYSSLREILSKREVRFTLDPSLDRLPMIEADIDGVRKVFYHLMVNAIKYTPDGGRVRIWGRKVKARDPSDEPFIEIVVSDTGIGIDPELQDMIFAKFYPAGDVTSHSSGSGKFKGGGPGLGLAIARGIVEAHGGRIWVESPGHDEKRCPGSKFHVLLPVHAAPGAETRRP